MTTSGDSGGCWAPRCNGRREGARAIATLWTEATTVRTYCRAMFAHASRICASYANWNAMVSTDRKLLFRPVPLSWLGSVPPSNVDAKSRVRDNPNPSCNMHIIFITPLMISTLHLKSRESYSPIEWAKAENTFEIRALLTIRLQSRGMTRNPDGKRGTSSDTATSTGAKTSWAQAPTAFSSTPLQNCIPHPTHAKE